MKITDIQPQQHRAKRDSVFVDGRFAFGLAHELTLQLKLEPGQELDPAAIDDLIGKAERRDALNYAVRLLAGRDRSQRELHDRLKRRKHAEPVIRDTIARLNELHLIDDQRFAETLARDRIAFGRRGKRLIAQELRRKGVTGTAIDQALAQAGNEEEAARAVILKAAGRYAKEEPRMRYRKLYALLARRGFAPPVISRILAEAEKQAFAAADEAEAAPESPNSESNEL